jgi:peptide/nickel transport system ATP-binding protein
MNEPIISVRNLRVSFEMATGEIEVLKGVDFDIEKASTIALVGESGSGKSVTAQAIMGILPATARITSGEIIFRDPQSESITEISTLSQDDPALRKIRGGKISIIFQEPMVALSPLHTIGDQISEALFCIRKPADRKDSREPKRCWIWSAFQTRLGRSELIRSSCQADCANAQ